MILEDIFNYDRDNPTKGITQLIFQFQNSPIYYSAGYREKVAPYHIKTAIAMGMAARVDATITFDFTKCQESDIKDRINNMSETDRAAMLKMMPQLIGWLSKT